MLHFCEGGNPGRRKDGFRLSFPSWGIITKAALCGDLMIEPMKSHILLENPIFLAGSIRLEENVRIRLEFLPIEIVNNIIEYIQPNYKVLKKI